MSGDPLNLNSSIPVTSFPSFICSLISLFVELVSKYLRVWRKTEVENMAGFPVTPYRDSTSPGTCV